MGSHALIMVYSPDQSNQLGVLDGDNDSVSQVIADCSIKRIDYPIRIL